MEPMSWKILKKSNFSPFLYTLKFHLMGVRFLYYVQSHSAPIPRTAIITIRRCVSRSQRRAPDMRPPSSAMLASLKRIADTRP